MTIEWRECPNCGGCVGDAEDACTRCGESRNSRGSGRPQFTPEAREAPDDLGGLLRLHSVSGQTVRYVGHCAGGAIGIDAVGNLIWRHDWGYVGNIVMDGEVVFVDGIPIDIDTGRSLLR
jgi:hypothetical protein